MEFSETAKAVWTLTENWRALQRHAARAACLVCALGVGGCEPREYIAHDPNVVSMLLPRDAQEVDPRFVGDVYGLRLSRLIFASLVRIDPQTLEAVPDLAERVEVISDTEYRVTLRAGLHFSDGSVLDANDVIATYRSVVDPRMHSRYALSYARIVDMEALDATHVVFRLNGPHASFLTDLELPILRSEDAHRHIPFAADPAPIGAGPYLLAKRQTGLIDLAPNPRWYAGTPHVPHVRMLVVHDANTRALRLLAGAADFEIDAVPPGLVPLFTPKTDFVVETAPGIATTYLGINTQSPVLSDVRVRRALAYAIDRTLLISTKFAGRARLARSFIPEGHWAYDPTTPDYAFDPARARALLDEAGHKADGSSARLHLRLRCGNDRFRVSIARALAAMLSDVGIEVSVEPTETATLIADLDRGRFELTLLQFPELIEPHVLSWLFSSARVPRPGHDGMNRWRIENPELDAALERGRRSLDREQRRAAYADVQRILADQLPVVPLWHEAVVAVRAARTEPIAVPRDGRFSTLAR